MSAEVSDVGPPREADAVSGRVRACRSSGARSPGSWRVFFLVCVVAAIVPLFGAQAPPPRIGNFPGWPSELAGKPLRMLPLGPIEQRFAEDFPGRIARFSDGEHEIVIRWVAQETRRLHPASDCFRGSGYSVKPQALIVDSDGARWGSFIAARGGEQLTVRERIYDGAGNQWTDVSAWYWAATTGKSRGPWWALTIASKQRDLPSQRLALEVE
jgi:hypothetical protein